MVSKDENQATEATEAPKGFVPPATQSDLDRIVETRLARERAKFADYDELKSKAEQFDARAEADKTEAQKLQETVAQLEKEKVAAERSALISRVAQEKGVPASLLAGGTEEEVAAAADALIAFRGEKPSAPPADGVQGNVGAPVNTGKAQKTMADLESMSPTEIDAAREAGELDDLLAGKVT